MASLHTGAGCQAFDIYVADLRIRAGRSILRRILVAALLLSACGHEEKSGSTNNVEQAAAESVEENGVRLTSEERSRFTVEGVRPGMSLVEAKNMIKTRYPQAELSEGEAGFSTTVDQTKLNVGSINGEVFSVGLARQYPSGAKRDSVLQALRAQYSHFVVLDRTPQPGETMFMAGESTTQDGKEKKVCRGTYKYTIDKDGVVCGLSAEGIVISALGNDDLVKTVAVSVIDYGRWFALAEQARTAEEQSVEDSKKQEVQNAQDVTGF